MRRALAVLVLILAIFASAVPVASAHYGATRWDCLAHYESTHRWHYNGSSGYDGGLQYHPDTWKAYTGRREPQYAYLASRKFQIRVAKRVVYYGWGSHNPQGWTAWRNNWWNCN